MKRVMMIKSRSLYDSLRVFTDKLAEEFGKRGIETVILDLMSSKEQINDVLVYCAVNHVDAVFSFNHIAYNLEVDNKTIAECMEAPEYVWIVDHPMRHIHRFMNHSGSGTKVKVVTVDEDHSEYANKYIDTISDARMIELGGIKSDKDILYSERTIGVLFTGSYYSPEHTLQELKDVELSDLINTVLHDIIDMMKQNPRISEEKAFQIYFKDHGWDSLTDKIPSFMQKLIIIDTYLRNYRRHECIRTLAESGIKVNVYGTGWENFDCKAKENIIVGPPVGYLESLDIMADSKIVLNMMPEFKRGTHDRVVCAMCNGAVALTDPSTYYETEFTDGEDIVFYDMANLEELPRIVNDILSDEEKAGSIALNGQKKALLDHTWKNSADELIRMMGL